MEHRIIKISILTLLLSFLVSACYYDNKQDLYPFDSEACNLENVTFSATVQPILESTCVTCHQQSNPSGGVRLDNYTEVKKVADNGKLWGSINHDAGFTPMPQGGGKLSDCSLLQIEQWINSGSPNN